MRARLFPAILVAMLSASVFLAWMHPAVLDPRNVGWLLDGNDRGQSAIGLAAYLRGGDAWPSLHDPLIMAPDGVTLLFTDSIPVLGLLLKPLASTWLASLQFVGLWYGLCVILQAAFAWALVRPATKDPLVALLGAALLTAMPVLFNRYGHASLCAQWLILWALWVYVDDRRDRSWGAVLCVAALVHSYLLVMVAAIWASALLRGLVLGPARTRRLAGALGTVFVVAALVSLHGVYGDRFVSTHYYGSWPVALDAWWNPANPSYSALLPSSKEDAGTGFEGFQYLGAGLLALVVVAIGTALCRGVAVALEGTIVRRLAWLLPAFAILAIIAIGPAPMWRGQALFVLPLAPWVIDLLDPVRAAGRLVWPATYALALAVVVLACRQRYALPILAAAVVLQIVDLAPMTVAIRATSARADDRRIYRRTLDPRWDAVIADADTIAFEPAARFRDLALMEEVGWRAVRLCRPMRYFYTSRETVAARRRVDAEGAAFRRGEIDPARLYILLDGRFPTALRGRVRLLDGIAIIAPTIVRPRQICPPVTAIHP